MGQDHSLPVRPPPIGQPPESIVYTEPISLERDNSDEKFGRARITHDFRINAHPIRPRLYLGGASAAMDPHEIHEERFTHVVNCLSASCAKFPEQGSLREPSDRQAEAYRAAGLQPPDRLCYLTLDVLDISEQDLLYLFPRTCAWIEARLNGESDSDEEPYDPVALAEQAEAETKAAAKAAAKAVPIASPSSSSPDDGGSNAVPASTTPASPIDSSPNRVDAGGPASASSSSENSNTSTASPSDPASSSPSSSSASSSSDSSSTGNNSSDGKEEAEAEAANAAIIAERKSHKRPKHFRAFDRTAPLPSMSQAQSYSRPRHANNRVLVHCMAGVSRSASVVMAYLMWKEGITAARALREVQLRRSIVNPNEGFREQLLLWEEALQTDRLVRGLPPLKRVDESLLEAHPELKAITNLFS